MGWKANYLAAHGPDRVIGWTNPYGKRLGNPYKPWTYVQLRLSVGSTPVTRWITCLLQGSIYDTEHPQKCTNLLFGKSRTQLPYIFVLFALLVWYPMEKFGSHFLMIPETGSVVQYGSVKIPHPFKASCYSTPQNTELPLSLVASRHWIAPHSFSQSFAFKWQRKLRRTLKMERCMKMSHLHVSSIAVSNVVCAWICIYVFVMSQMIKVLQRKEEATMCSAHRFEELWFWDIPKMHHMFRSVIKVIINNQPSRIHNLSRWNKAFTPLDTCCKYIPWRLLGSEPFLSIMIDGSRFSTFWSVSGSVRHSKSQLAHLRPFFFCWEWISLQFQMHYYQYFLAAWATKHGGATWPNKNKVTNI